MIPNAKRLQQERKQREEVILAAKLKESERLKALKGRTAKEQLEKLKVLAGKLIVQAHNNHASYTSFSLKETLVGNTCNELVKELKKRNYNVTYNVSKVQIVNDYGWTDGDYYIRTTFHVRW